MSIQSFIKKVCVQTAVVWNNPQSNGFGGFTYDPPKEVSCRWTENGQVMRDRNGLQYTSKANVMLTEDVSLNGYMMLGNLESIENLLDSEEKVDPISISNTYMIGRFDKVPEFRSATKFVRTAYLGYQQQGS